MCDWEMVKRGTEILLANGLFGSAGFSHTKKKNLLCFIYFIVSVKCSVSFEHSENEKDWYINKDLLHC